MSESKCRGNNVPCTNTRTWNRKRPASVAGVPRAVTDVEITREDARAASARTGSLRSTGSVRGMESVPLASLATASIV